MPKVTTIKTCPACDTEFSTWRGFQIYCGDVCQRTARNNARRAAWAETLATRPKRACPRCEMEFIPTDSRMIYCSRTCKDRTHATERLRRPVVDRCHVEGCTRAARVAGMSKPVCGLHHERMIRWGQYGPPEPVRRPRRKKTPYTDLGEGRWLATDSGYVYRKVGASKSRLEHRVVMEEILGRPLTRRESVHHMNGVKHDNRRANLELWVKPQPAGQRVQDLVDWVVENYPEYVTAAIAHIEAAG